MTYDLDAAIRAATARLILEQQHLQHPFILGDYHGYNR